MFVVGFGGGVGWVEDESSSHKKAKLPSRRKCITNICLSFG